MSETQTFTEVYDNRWPAQGSTLRLRGAQHAPIQHGDLTVTPILVHGEHSFGAEVAGVDWSKPLPQELVEQLRSLSNTYAVLIFRRTGLDNAGHIAFSQQLGSSLETNPFYYGRHNDRVGEPALWDVGNIELDGSIVRIDSPRWHHSRGNALWHTDSSYHQRRSKYSLLLAHGEPARGGFYTHFADTRRAYADLPQAKKDELEGLIVEHDLWHSRRLGSPVHYREPTAEQRRVKPPAFHRLVQEAPGGEGKKTLFLAAHAKRVVGVNPPTPEGAKEGEGIEKSQRMIWDLIEHCTQPQYVFSMEWLDGGDMVWWDNRASMHRANPYAEGMTARDVRRSTVIDDGEFADGVSREEVERAELRV